MSSLEHLKNERLNRFKATLKEQGDGFSFGLKQAFTVGGVLSTNDLGQLFTNETMGNHLDPIINDSRPAIRPRPPRVRHHAQPTAEVMSQMSQTVESNQVDPAAILQKLDPLLTQLHQHTTQQDSQQASSTEERSKLFQELLELSLDEITVACQHLEKDNWIEDALVDLCDSFGSMENVGHAIASTVIQALVYPYIVKLNTSLSRLLMNSLLQLGKTHGNALLNGLIFPLLSSDDKNIHRCQMELISKLATNSLNVSSRTTFLRFLISGNQDKAPTRGIHTTPSEPTLQLINTLSSISPPLDPTVLRQLIDMIYQVVQARPKDKVAMQILLTLTSKHTQALVDAHVLDDLEKVAIQSNMFLKRTVVAQLASIRKKAQE
ncbi:hypothetical protein BC941DRAFT_410831 [Chlamydoabsidia padenii]|nr:hypothetical protein BC941DRAFT_410831 [Chlamydoabsidia padenii]